MPRLYVYIPFGRQMAGESIRPPVSALLRDNAEELASITRDVWRQRATEFEETILLYADSNREGLGINPGDVVVVHAHGGSEDADLTDDDGRLISLGDVIKALIALGAQVASSVHFAVCYSANDNHVAQVWRQNEGQNQRVRGSVGVLEGGLVIGLNRSGVPRGTILDEDRLKEL